MDGPSHLRAAIGVLARGLRERRRAPGEPPRGARRRLAAERPAIVVDPRRVARYRRVSGDPAGTTAPPTFASTWETALALELFARSELPLPRGGLVHLAGERVVLRPIHEGDRVRCRVEVDTLEPHPRGVRAVFVARDWNAAGHLCQENRIELLVPDAEATRGRAARGRTGEEAGARASGEGAEGEWREVERWSLPANLGRRYARASGDFNPIHLWSWSARLLGFPAPILQGCCTEAMAARALAQAFWGGDPAGLRRLAIRFPAPLALPGEARLLAIRSASGACGSFRVVPTEGDGRPFAEGEFVGGEVAPQG